MADWLARAGSPRICTVGHATIDHSFDIEAFPAQPTKTPASAYRMASGGMAANASIAAVKLGAQVRLHAAVGADLAGDYLWRYLQDVGVLCDQLQRVPQAQSSISAVVIDAQGERQIYNSRGTALALAAPLDTRALAGCELLMVDPRWMAGAVTALNWARANGVPSMLDGDLSRQADLRTLAELADWAVFSESGLAAFAPGCSQAQGLELALEMGAEVAMVTLGACGVAWMRRGEARNGRVPMHRMAGFPVQALDTNGAGDVFHAALAVAVARGWPDAAAVRHACAAAAIKCERNGGVVNGPDAAEVEAFLRTHGEAANAAAASVSVA